MKCRHTFTLRASYLFYFLLHILQLALPLPSLHVKPFQQLSFLSQPVPLAVLHAAAQVHGRRICICQDPLLLFPLPAGRQCLTVLFSSAP